MNTGKAHGSALGADEIGRGQEDPRLRPGRGRSRSTTWSSSTPGRRWTAAQAAKAEWQKAFDAWAAANPERKALFDRLVGPRAAGRLDRRAAVLAGRSEGRRHPGRVRQGAERAGAGAARAVGRLGRPGRVEQHHDGGRGLVRPGRGEDQALERAARTAGPCTSGSASTRWARSCPASCCTARPAPYGGTFLQFSDYMRGAVRLAALMGAPAIYVWTHDSIGLGEDGPTHQPVEHLAALRAIPGSGDRPAGGRATRPRYAWQAILEQAADWFSGPVGSGLTRQAVPDAGGHVRRGRAPAAATCSPMPQGDLQVILMATGSEVQLAVAGPGGAAGRGHRHPGGVRAVPGLVRGAGRRRTSSRCCRRRSPPGCRSRPASRSPGGAGSAAHGRPVSLEHYGASADAETLFREFGFTPEPPWPPPRNRWPRPEAGGSAPSRTPRTGPRRRRHPHVDRVRHPER